MALVNSSSRAGLRTSSRQVLVPCRAGDVFSLMTYLAGHALCNYVQFVDFTTSTAWDQFSHLLVTSTCFSFGTLSILMNLPKF